MLKPGDKAPSFTLRDQSGADVSLADFAGRTLLVYFYPKADTPGCTTQSCAVRDAREDLTSLGVDVVGISPDEPGPQTAFDEKFGLGFPLLSDPDHAVAEAWGVGVRRRSTATPTWASSAPPSSSTPTANIRDAWYKVSPKDTVPNAMKALEQA